MARERSRGEVAATRATRSIQARIGWVQIDCADPDRLREFWRILLRVEVDESPSPPAFRCLLPGEAGGTGLCFQRVPEPKVGKNRVHLDVIVDDLEAATTLVRGLGGRTRGAPDVHEAGWRWRTMADPEGNEFCLIPATDDRT